MFKPKLMVSTASQQTLHQQICHDEKVKVSLSIAAVETVGRRVHRVSGILSYSLINLNGSTISGIVEICSRHG